MSAGYKSYEQNFLNEGYHARCRVKGKRERGRGMMNSLRKEEEEFLDIPFDNLGGRFSRVAPITDHRVCE